MKPNIFFALIAVLGFFIFTVLDRGFDRGHIFRRVQPNATALLASQKTLQAFSVVGKAKKKAGGVNPKIDPSGTGLIGMAMSPITTSPGSLEAKQISVNPNFAAIFVSWLKQLHVQPGEGVALSLSGSFPALNIAAWIAIQSLDLKPLVVSSLSSSQWGANDPEWLWVDYESLLYREGVLHSRSGLVTLGGIEDRALGLAAGADRNFSAALARNPGVVLTPIESYADSVEKRLRFYDEAGVPIRVFFNVGGGSAAVGKKTGKGQLKIGVNRYAPAGFPEESVAGKFFERNIPVIHVGEMAEMAEIFGLSKNPHGLSPVGEFKIPLRQELSRWQAVFLWTALVTALAGKLLARKNRERKQFNGN